MSRNCSLFRRALLFVSGVLFLFLLGFAGLGWVAWKRGRLLGLIMSYERVVQVQEFYRMTAAGLLPGDSDGDGVCDGNELFLKTDPQNPRDHWPLDLEREQDGIVVAADTESSVGTSARDILLLSPGEKSRVRAKLKGILARQPYPAGFRFQVTPSSHLLLAFPGGKLSTKAMALPGPEDRVLAFDIEISTAPTKSKTPSVALPSIPTAPVIEKITITNFATKEDLFELQIWRAWRLPAIIPAVTIAPPPEGLSVVGQRSLQLHWSTPTEQPDALAIEAARDSDDAEWFLIHIVPPQTTDTGMEQQLGEWCFSKPLKFRVVPIRYSPP